MAIKEVLVSDSKAAVDFGLGRINDLLSIRPYKQSSSITFGADGDKCYISGYYYNNITPTTVYLHHKQDSSFYLDISTLIPSTLALYFKESNTHLVFDEMTGEFQSSLDSVGLYKQYEGHWEVKYKASFDVDTKILKIYKEWEDYSYETSPEDCLILFETEDMSKVICKTKDVIKSETELYKYKYYRPIVRRVLL